MLIFDKMRGKKQECGDPLDALLSVWVKTKYSHNRLKAVISI